MLYGNVDELPTQKSGFHISHLNLQSIRNKIDVVRTHVYLLNFDVFSFSESWLDERLNNSLLNVNGYNLLRHDRTWSDSGNGTPKRGGGTGLYMKQEYNFSISSYEGYNYNCSYLEIFWLEIILPHSKNIVIGVLYRPPSGNVNQFCDKITDICNDLANRGNTQIFLLGDININYLDKMSDDT